jgi:hypothetical protein
MSVLLDTRPQVVDSGPVWKQYGEPLALTAWLARDRGN